MSDYDHCTKHDISFLMPELLMCPHCAREALDAGLIPEPHGDALLDYCRTLESRQGFLVSALTDLYEAASEEWPERACVVFAKRVLDVG